MQFNTNELILLSSLSILFMIQLIYYLALFNRIYTQNKAVKRSKITFTDAKPPVSVIICAKNESENLRDFLPSVLEQDYPHFEVIVINDGSTDESEELLSMLEKQYPHLYHSFTPENSRYISHKKLALTLGVKASKNEWLVFTEANCYPVDKNWLQLMARNFTSGTEIVLGYSGYERGKGWLHKRIAYDALFSSICFLGFAIARKPYMGIGRNMAYRRELFFRQKGYSAHLNLQRGDDDLFINQIANSKNTRVETSPGSTVRMKPVVYKKDWWEEKVSYIATSKRYKGSQRFILGFETFSRLLLYAVMITCIVAGTMKEHWTMVGIAGSVFLIRYIVQALIVNKTAKELGEQRRYYLTLPVFDLLHPLQSLTFRIFRLLKGGQGDFMTR